ncbi:MAG: NADH-quinone oxidoreductase subunit A [Anaerolineae bacterium]|jgi:NADH:ubiquinone oxidoreductase subunit 3 (subunit A)|nr:NADH-quinone oxidoreductase subunit A [Anaerolineae bacterium]
MEDFLLAPPIAFAIYLGLVGILSGFGRVLAKPSETSSAKSSTYASGEAPPVRSAVPGYTPFFVIALFFAILHLGVLMLGSSNLSSTAGIYLVGLILALLALILG